MKSPDPKRLGDGALMVVRLLISSIEPVAKLIDAISRLK